MAAPFDYNNDSHRRYNALTRSWVLCSPHRTKRPWQGQQENPQLEHLPKYDPSCFLCPSNERNTGLRNPNYKTTYVFPNDYAAVKEDQTSMESHDDLLRAESVRGQCHVICFSPRHDLTMAEMTVEEISIIVDQWADCYKTMAENENVTHVQIFENKGAAMGCSNPHPHGQMWCTERIPEEPQKELDSLLAYQKKHGRCLLCDYAAREMTDKERLVIENDSFVCVVPFWAIWPFEVMLLSKSHVSNIQQLKEKQRVDLADILRRMTCRYDNLFECSFPYSMGIHQAPVRGDYDHAHFHIHFYPPLLRSASVRKFLVGFELLGEPQRDLTPEQAASTLTQQQEVHYKTVNDQGKKAGINEKQ